MSCQPHARSAYFSGRADALSHLPGRLPESSIPQLRPAVNVSRRGLLLGAPALVAVSCASSATMLDVQVNDRAAHEDAYLALLRPRLEAAERILRFNYDPLFANSRVANLTMADLPPSRANPLSPQQVRNLRILLLQPAAYVFGLAKPMPFLADGGLFLFAGRPFAALLLSSSFQGSRLVLEERIPAALAIASFSRGTFFRLQQILDNE